MIEPQIQIERTLKPAILRGLMCRCPQCGDAPLFVRGLTPFDQCPACGEDMTPQRADDFPAYLVILILGHVLVPIMVGINMAWDLPMVSQMIAWPLLMTVLAVVMIRPAKGAVISAQWALRMGGFEAQREAI